MWRKPPEGKPSSESVNPPASAPITSQEAVPLAAPRVSTPARSAPSVYTPQSAAGPASSATSKISSGLKIHGELSGDSDLYIDGEIQGKIRLAKTRVTVGPNGRVQADIEAREIVIDGTVQGNLKASESARFGASSRVVGTVLSPRIGIDDGARLRGKVETIPATPSRESSPAVKDHEPGDLQPIIANVEG
ncbi:MAG TPA: polymer-forming cytoskeletal protein [Candidatus Acidoferrales bacterium]|jgi:cytoskeletal protein CcmA (bactofilin family)|nr:polymer-forming cytoskeletal protein [Candidatus Acidoferrales bacterium]